MKRTRRNLLFLVLLVIPSLTASLAWTQTVLVPSKPGSPGTLQWQVVVNNGMQVPGDTRNFNSYNQPSVNANRLVVFRARSKGGPIGEPAHGVFTRDMTDPTSSLVTIFDRNTTVPQPNNLGTEFTEPPSFPRIDIRSDTIASRGNHQPVWEYTPANGGDKTSAGTTGIYTNPLGVLITGASNLGAVPDFSFWEVPGSDGIKFDVFPGAPSVTDGATIVFKGNYTVGTVEKTGVYYRVLENESIPLLGGDTSLAPAGGTKPVVLIADTNMKIPGTSTKFGSVSPPSAAGKQAVFSGFDNEDDPTLGGIYLASLQPNPSLTTLVSIGSQVPGERKGTVFNKLSESVSFDGRYVAFWGAWGNRTTKLTLQCPTEGNKVRIAYCNQQYPTGYKTTISLNQGIFVYDIQARETWAVATTPANFNDFVYWKFTGIVPGMGEMDGEDDMGEPAKWRSEEFVAVSGVAVGNLTKAQFLIAFKARTGHVELKTGAYENPVDGIYVCLGPDLSPTLTVVETGKQGTEIDPDAAINAPGSPITDIGLDRDGFRDRWLVINVRWGSEESGWAGIYLTEVSNTLFK
jgi:hypothetical protein